MSIVSLILIGCLGMVILAVSIILFVVIYQKKILSQQNQIHEAQKKHQMELLDATIQTAEIEREKIAKNIHDDIGTMLNVIKLHLTKISRNPDDKTLTQELIMESKDRLDEAIENIRGISKELMPPTLIKLGFEKGILELFRQINTLGEMRIHHVFEFNEIKLPTKTELHLFRIMQELLNNIIKHSKAKEVHVAFQSVANGIMVTISHDGTGITDEAVVLMKERDQGIGLKSIESRTQLIGASIQYLMMGDKNSKILIDIPLIQ